MRASSGREAHPPTGAPHERKTAETLKESQATYEAVFEGAPLGILVADSVTKTFRYANPAICELLGYSAAELVTMRVDDIHPPEDLAHVVAEFEAQARGEKALAPDIPCLRKNGDTVYADITVSVVQISGKPHSVGFFTDITERKQAEEEIKQLAKFPSENPNPVLRVSEDGTILYANPGSTPLLHWWNCPEGSRLPEHLAMQTTRTLESKAVCAVDVPCDEQVFSLTFSPIAETRQVNVYGLDVTDRRRNERRVTELNATLEAAQKMAKVGYWHYDIATQMPTWSDQMFEVCGYRKENGVPNYEEHRLTWHPDDWDMFDEAVQGCAQGRPYNIVVRIRFPDGSYHHVNTQGFPVHNKDGDITELFGTSQDITDLKKAEEVLRQQGELLDTVGRIAKVGGWEMDMITRKAKWTQGTRDIVEIEPGQPVPGPDEHIDFYLPEYRQMVTAAMEDLIERDTPLDVEAEGRTAKGNIRWYRALGRADRQNGKCVRAYGTLQDITERKRAENALRQSEQRFRNLYENSPYGIVVCELIRDETGTPTDFIPLEANEAAGTHTGILLGEFIDRYASEMVKPEILIDLLKTYGTVAETGKPARYSQYFELCDRTLDVTAFPLHADLFIINFVDISERVQAQKELQEHREHLEELVEKRTAEIVKLSSEQRTILDSVRAAIWYKDTQNRILRVNRAGAEAVGLQIEEIEGKLTQELFPNEADAYYEDDVEVMRSGTPKLGIVERLRTASGEVLWMLTDKIPCRDEAGDVAGVIAFAIDITEQKQAEEEARERTDELRTMVRAMAGREVRMTELKEEIRALQERLDETTAQKPSGTPRRGTKDAPES